ncbi:MAG: hypothetical protein ACYC3X_25040 [Pirellulaceae bacterium]
MRDLKNHFAMLVLSGAAILHTTCAEVAGQGAGQVSQRGISSRGINAIGSRSTMQRRPNATSPLMNQNQTMSPGNVNSGGPLNMGYVPIFSGPGFYLDPSMVNSGAGDIASPGDINSLGGEPATGVRPNIRPRLNIAEQAAKGTTGVLQTIRKTVLEQIARCPDKPFSSAWYAAHESVVPGGHEGDNAWSGSSWVEVKEWIGLDAEPQRYDYRPDSSGLILVYRNDKREGRAVDARKPAVLLASTSRSAADEPLGRSLGVFAAVPPTDKSVQTLFHLVVGKSGAVSGYQYDFTSDSVQPLQGAVDLAAQRAAWQAGNTVVEAGLKNLTEDVARALVFRDDGWTQSWILMRIPESTAIAPTPGKP